MYYQPQQPWQPQYQQPTPGRMQTEVRRYMGYKPFNRDAHHLARQGWAVVSTIEYKRRSGCVRMILLGFFCLVFPPRPEIIVTYQRIVY